jgi:hypothetical protein
LLTVSLQHLTILITICIYFLCRQEIIVVVEASARVVVSVGMGVVTVGIDAPYIESCRCWPTKCSSLPLRSLEMPHSLNDFEIASVVMASHASKIHRINLSNMSF